MSSIEKAWPTLKAHEGTRFTNHGWDPGGATKYGITLRYAREAGAIDADGDGRPDLDLDLDDDGDIDADDIRLVDEPKAIEVYSRWWEKQGYSRLTDQQVATKVMDLSINMGPRRAHLYLQRALGACGYRLVEDGKLGPKTVAAANEAEARELVLELCFQQAEHYRRWLDGYTKAPGDREVARAGLLERAAWPFVKGAYVPA